MTDEHGSEIVGRLLVGLFVAYLLIIAGTAWYRFQFGG